LNVLPAVVHGHPVRTVYALVGAFDVVVATICLIASSLVDVVPPESSLDESHTGTASPTVAGCDEPEQEASCTKSSSPRIEAAVPLLVVTLFFVANGGRDALLNTLLYSYVFEYLGWTVASSSLLVTTYHATRAVVHVVLIPVSRRMTPSRLMMFNVATLVVSSTLMLTALVGGEVGPLTVVGVVITALATSNIHQTSITLVDRTQPVMAPVMAVFIMALGVGQVVTAPLCGHLLQTSGVASFPAMLLALALTGLALFSVYCVMNNVQTERCTCSWRRPNVQLC